MGLVTYDFKLHFRSKMTVNLDDSEDTGGTQNQMEWLVVRFPAWNLLSTWQIETSKVATHLLCSKT